VRIYTRSGDQGETGLYGGQRVMKNHPRITAVGEVDELNAALGLCLASSPDADIREALERAQGDLFVMGADLASPAGEGDLPVPRVTEGMAAGLEAWIDRFEPELPPLRRFILPGGSALAAQLHFARGVCRRAERTVTAAAGRESLNPDAIVYLNRLSDLLFVLARAANRRAGVPETEWTAPGG
jgi:cob(I)alamin adenosyltransferase